MNPLLTAMIWAVAGLLAAYGLLRAFEWLSLYRPVRAFDYTPADFAVLSGYEEVEFMTEDAKRLYGWWLPVKNARGTVLYCHGNAENIGHLVDLAIEWHDLGVNVFLFDYRGYGRSRGFPTEQGTYRDARAAYEVVRARYDDAENPPVVVVGRSLGAAVAVQLALDKPVKGLILETPFTSTVEVGRELFPWFPVSLAAYRYDTRSKIARVGVPVVIAFSEEDGLLPRGMGRRLFAAAAEPKRYVELKGSHNEAGWRTTPDHLGAVKDLLDRVLGPAKPAVGPTE